MYVDYKKPAIITCRKHGDFKQTPDNHYRNAQGCPKCKNTKLQKTRQLSFEGFVARANSKHNNKFTYSYTEWTNLNTGTVLVHCPHGVFAQAPVNHLSGRIPCPKCGDKTSKAEMEVADYLSILTKVIQRDRSVIKPKELDIYMPDNALAVEYSGMYWHSHGSIEEENKNRYNHYNKYKSCAANGVRLITIYETEWLERQKAIKRLLRNSIGKSKGKLMARKCELKKVTRQEAVSFYDKYHPQGGAGNGEHYGLYWKNKLVSCMRFTYGVNDRGTAAANRVWTLSRYATRVTVSGGASKLFKAFIEEYSPEEVKSFSDNRYFAGGMYAQLGFDLEEDVSPDYQIWSPKIGLKPKSHYQRRNIQQRLIEHGMPDVFDPKTDTRTEREMTYLMGARRIYDCGKKRWVWKPK
jgi:Zn finger protein HypA/HybF involved in hydrogenase expression